MQQMRYRRFAAVAVLFTVAGCWRTKAPSEWKYEVRPEVFSQGFSGSPKVAGAAVATSDAPTTRTAVKIDPSEAGGYENVPESFKNLYGPSPMALGQRAVVEQTLAHNRDIKIQNYVLRQADLGIPLSKGIYDLLIEASAMIDTDKTLSSTSLAAPGTRRHRDYDLSVSQLAPTGAVAKFAYAYSRVSQVFAFSSLNPAITQGFTLSVTQPLLQGFGPEITNIDINIARLTRDVSAADFETRLQDQMKTALDLYWGLVLAVNRYDVQVISYTAALDLLRINSAKVDAGVLPPTEVLQAKASAEARREAIIRARQAVRDAEDRLKQVMFFQDGAPNWEIEIKPQQELVWSDVRINPAAVLADALEARPEIRSASTRLDRSDLEIIKAKDKIKPSLDVVGSALYTGVGDTRRGSWETFDELESNKFAGGLQFSMPLQNRQARYNHAQRLTGREIALEEYEKARDGVAFDVRQAVRDLKTSKERIEISESRVLSEEANLDAERKRFEVGVSTSFQVLQFQENLANALDAQVQAIVDYNTALVALERARGTILLNYGVQIESPDLSPSPEEPIFPIGLD